MNPPTLNFVNGPEAIEARQRSVDSGFKKAPVLRSWSLALVAFFLRNVSFLQKYLWNKAEFAKLRDLHGLDQSPRYDPTVIPLGENDSSLIPMPLTDNFDVGSNRQFYSASDYHHAYLSGRVTPYQVAQAVLRLIRSNEETSRHGASWVEINEDRTLLAARLSTDRFASGTFRGILDGVPFGVKADIEVKGFIPSMGMKVVSSLHCFQPATESVWPVEKLEEAGAIIIGINNMHENGADTSGNNPATGTPTNAYNRSYYPGGSSSGAGASLATGLVPICLGTDAGGSVRIPAAMNGVYALKPTHHRLGYRNSTVSVIGPMAATATDLTIAYRVAAQSKTADNIQSLFAASIPPNPSMPKLVGLCRDWLAQSDPLIQAEFAEMTDYLTTHLGYQVVDIRLPYLHEGQLAHGLVCLTEAVDKARSRGSSSQNWLDLLNCQGQVLLSTAQYASATDLIRCGQVRQVIMQHLAWLFKKYPGLMILSPTVPFLGWEIHQDDGRFGLLDGNMCWKSTRYTWVANFSGVPCVQFPIGYANPACGSGKLPVGAMAMGEWGAEEQLLCLAREVETYLGDVSSEGRIRPYGWVDVLSLAEKEGTAEECTWL